MNLAFLTRRSDPRRNRADDWPRGTEDRAVAQLRLLGEAAGDKERKIDIARRLLEADTSSNRIRNAAAIALADLLGKEAKTAITDVLRRPDMAQSAGSLLFALNEVNASLPLDLLVDLIEHGSLEAQGEALVFLENGRIEPFAADGVERAVSRLNALRAADDQKVRNVVEIALDYMDDLALNSSPDPSA